MRRLYAIIVVLNLLSPGLADQPDVPKHEKSFRNLTVTVPRLAQAPTIDGTVNADEWAGAGIGPRLITWERDDLLTDGQSRFYFAATDDALYLAWQFQRPRHAIAPRATIFEQDKGFFRTDDAIEFMLNCTELSRTRKSGSDFTMHWNALGTRFDRNLPRHQQGMYDMRWTGPWQAKSRTVENFGWEGEAVFPLAMLEHAIAPAPGVTWAFQLCENRATPEAVVNLQGYQINWFTTADYPTMLFTGADGVVARVLDCGAMAEAGRSGVVLELLNPGAAARTVIPKLSLYQRKAEAPSTLPYLRAFDQARDRPEDLAGTGKVALFLSDQRVSDDLVAENYDLVQEQAEPVTLGPGERRRIDFTIDKRAGNFLAFYDVRYAPGQAPSGLSEFIAGAPLPYMVPEPLAIKSRNFMLVDQTLAIQADLRYVEHWDPTQGQILATLQPVGGGKPVFEQAFSGESYRNTLNFDLPAKRLAVGDYQLTLIARDSAGKELAKRQQTLNVPAVPVWHSNPVGLAPVVPPPWKPIEVAAAPSQAAPAKLSFLMGEVELAQSVLPSSIKVQSIYDTQREPVLRAPIALRGVVDGQEVAWHGPVTLSEQRPDLVRATSTAVAANVQLQADAAFEYDGMQKVTLTLTPQPGSAPKVQQFTLSIPLAKDFAQLYHTVYAQLRQEKHAIKNGSLPAEGVEHDWRPVIWLGNSRRGLEWFTENWKGWRCSNDNDVKTIQITNGPDGATLNIHFILMNADKPLLLDKPRQITFGLMFTPARSIERRPLRMGLGYYSKEVPKHNSQYLEGELAAGVNTVEVWNNYDTQGWPDLTEERAAQLRRWGEALHQRGVKVTPYSGWYISRKAQVYPTWGAQMLVEPNTDGGCGCDVCCWNSPVTDAYLWQYAQAAKAAAYDGYRLDAGFSVSPCQSLRHHGPSSCGWIDDFGRLQPSLAIFAAREGAKRMYRMFHGGDVMDHGVCIIPPTQHCKFAAILSHFDAGISAEGAERNAKGMKEFDLSYWRAVLMEDRRGLQLLYWPKTDTLGVDSRLAVGQIHRLTPRGGSLLSIKEQSNSRSAYAVASIWAAEQWIERLEPGVEFFGYWENKALFDSGNPEVYGSFHVRRGKKILLAMLNRERGPVETTVRFDLKALGFTGKVHAIDAILREPIDIRDGAMTLTMTAEGIRMVQIAAEPFEIYQPLKAGANLIAELEPSAWPSAPALPQGWSLDNADKVPAPPAIVDGKLVFSGIAGQTVQLKRAVTLTPGKPYMLEAEVSLACDDSVFLGPLGAEHQFGIVFGDYYHPLRTLGSQLVPGRTETFRIYFTPTEQQAQAHVRLWLNGNGKALVHRIGVYEIDRPQPGFQFAAAVQENRP